MKTVEKIERKLPVLKARKRVAAYARVSMESERMQHSLSAQVSYYSALIQKNPEWEYAGVFADYGISGTGTKKREEFNRMLAECEAGNIDIILTKSIQRFARNTVDLLNTVRHLKDLGLSLIHIYIYNRYASLYVSDIMMVEGPTVHNWTPAPNEIYTNEVKIDKHGIAVSNADVYKRQETNWTHSASTRGKPKSLKALKASISLSLTAGTTRCTSPPEI